MAAGAGQPACGARRSPCVLILIALCAGGCWRSEADRAADRAVDFLAWRQSSDGSWRSGVHGVFRDGTALTPHVARALRDAGRGGDAVDRGRKWLQGVEQTRLAYPTYAAADASYVLPPGPWLAMLRSQQVVGQAAFPSTGGWAYSSGPMDSTTEANTSVTAYALCALADGGAAAGDPALVGGREFLLRCRNEDGGFRFGVTETADNKPGPGISYGSATADAVRGLLAAGASPDDPAVRGGVEWLLRRFDPAHVPGDFTPAREPMRDGNYFYYLDAMTDAFRRAAVPEDRWAPAVAAELVRRQRADGSWQNLVSAGREDDPLVATAFAVRVLARCERPAGSRRAAG